MYLVLAIEDDAAIRTVLRMLLEAQHYRVVEAESGKRQKLEIDPRQPRFLLTEVGVGYRLNVE